MNKKLILKNIVSGLLLLMIFIPMITRSADIEGEGPDTGIEGSGAGPTAFRIKIDNPFNCGANCTLVTFVNKIIDDLVLPIGAVIAVLMVMYAGFLFVTAGGNSSKIDKAKEALLYAVIGAAVLLGAKLISTAIQGTITQLKG